MAIRDYFAIFFAAPEAVLSYPDTGKLNSVAGGTITVPFSVLNEVRFTSLKIAFPMRPRIRSFSTGHEELLNVDPPSLPSLGPGQSAQVKVYGMAPQLETNQGVPQRYQLSIPAEIEAGMLRGAASVTSERELLVWPAKLGQSAPRVIRYVGNLCEIGEVVYVSEPYQKGVHGEIVVVSSPGEVGSVNIMAPGSTELTSTEVGDSAGSTKKVEFRTPPLEKFQEYRLRLFLDISTSANEQVCSDWSKKIDIHFE